MKNNKLRYYSIKYFLWHGKLETPINYHWGAAIDGSSSNKSVHFGGGDKRTNIQECVPVPNSSMITITTEPHTWQPVSRKEFFNHLLVITSDD